MVMNLNLNFFITVLYSFLQLCIILIHLQDNNSIQYLLTKKKMIKAVKNLLILNIVMFVLHILANCRNIFYFCQLTILAQTLVIANFAFSLTMNQRKNQPKTKLFLSRLHLMTIAVQICVVVGYWGIRLMMGRKFIGGQMQQSYYGYLQQILSIFIHGGSLLTMMVFVKFRQIFKCTSIKQKLFLHLMAWGVPFCLVQCIHWNFSGQHVYGFISHMSWPVLISFELFMFSMAVAFDYIFEILHGVKEKQKHGMGQKINQIIQKCTRSH